VTTLRDDGVGTPTVCVATVVVPFRDAEATIVEQLAALAAQDLEAPWEVVLVDNRSSDGSRALAERWAATRPVARVVDAVARDGVAYARNVGLTAATSPLLAYCDADDVVEPGWLRALVAALAAHDLVGGLVDELAMNAATTLSWQEPRRRDGLQVSHRFLPYAPGANFGVRRDVALAVGGWDERFPYGGNDVEFSWRVQLAGYRIGWVPDAVVRYRLRDSTSAFARQMFWRGVATVALVRAFRARGARPRPWSETARVLAKLVVLAPDAARDRSRRGRWIGMVAHQAGRVAARPPGSWWLRARRGA
jgi:glycosyltransferase involved in cell wall biosynthesis